MIPHLPLDSAARRGAAPANLPAFVWAVGARARRRILLCAEVERLRLLLARYALEAGASVVLFACMFLVFSWLGTVVDGRLAPFGGPPRVLAVLYVAWVLVSTTAGGSTSQLCTDAQIGMLESLFLGAAPVVRILEMRALAQALQGAAMGALLLLAFCLGTCWLPSFTVLATCVAAFAGCVVTAVGLALALAGATLLSKRVGALMMPINFLCMLALMGGPARAAEPLAWSAALPFVADAAALRQAVAHDVFASGTIAIALLGALPWYLVGRLVLACCVAACRRRGTIHAY
jgi:hypothetical protein